MRSRSVIVIQIRTKDTTEGRFVEHEHMVQALAPDRTNHALDVGPLPGGSGCTALPGCPCLAPVRGRHRRRSHRGRAADSAEAGQRAKLLAVAVRSTPRWGRWR